MPGRTLNIEKLGKALFSIYELSAELSMGTRRHVSVTVPVYLGQPWFEIGRQVFKSFLNFRTGVTEKKTVELGLTD